MGEKVASAKQDFERFVTWLHLPEAQATPEARRLANLVVANFAELVLTSRQRNQRSIHLVRHVRMSLAQTPDGLPDIQPEIDNDTRQWIRLQRLTLGPFRGFRTPESFDLQKRIILVHGPNGSGKTSFCEGLEYALLGVVEEAGTRRIGAQAYLANLHAGRFERPVLRAADRQGRQVSVVADANSYRFCFIEKNRIDAFSRIAARPPAQRTELIATLFGMDDFNEFVSHFNETIDQQLTLTPIKQFDLTNRRNALAVDQATINSEAEGLSELIKREAEIAGAYSAGMTYTGLKTLIGSAETPGPLQELENTLNKVPPAMIGLTRRGLLDAFETVRSISDELAGIEDELEARSRQVSFRDLYTAVLALQPTEDERCPACDTPLTGPLHVMVNPYEKALAGLDELRELGELQEKREAVQSQVAMALRTLRQQLATLATFVAERCEQSTPVGQYLAALEAQPVGNWWASIYPVPQMQDGTAITHASMLDQILGVADSVAVQDAASRLAFQNRQRDIVERDRLNEFRLSVHVQDEKRQRFVEGVEEARGRIDAFERENATLIDEVAQEALDIAWDTQIKAAYDHFLAKLRTYRDQLPGILMADLNDTGMSLYNEFNSEDINQDKLAALYLPVTGEQKIEISFRSNPDIRVDALQVLSEGHIRCLGLAILLAKSTTIGCPLIVFDDAINAIDHDHRRGIREAIFESDRFAEKQLIVTCHSNEFIKDVQQHLRPQQRDDCTVYLFRNHDGNYQPRVTGNVPSRNYVEKARASRNALDDREALASSRRALEMLSEKTWRWLTSHDQGTLKLTISGVDTKPDLRNLCEALRNRLNNATTFTHANKPSLLTAYDTMLGIPSGNLVWIYLNRGTHEEANRDDFDTTVVESVVQTLEDIERLDLRPGR